MPARSSVVMSVLVAIALLVAAPRPGMAADAQEASKEMAALNKKAIAAFKTGDHKGAKAHLLKALALGEESDIGAHPIMARTYLHLGVVHLDGLKDKAKATGYFNLAVKLALDIDLSPGVGSDKALRALEDARAGGGAGATPVAEEAAPAAPAVAPAVDKQASKKLAQLDEKMKDERAAKEQLQAALAHSQQAEREAKQQEQALQKLLVQAEAREKKVESSLQKLQADAARFQEREKQMRAENDKLKAEIARRDEQVKLQRQLSAKEIEEREKQLADAADRESKMLAAKDKLEKERQQTLAKEQQKKADADSQRAARDKLALGPDMPGDLPHAISCHPIDEHPPGVDLFVHCAVVPRIKATTVALYFRPSGALHFNSVRMERNKKGWYVALIPGSQLKGKALHVYSEARDTKDKVLASDGAANSPNIVVLRAGATAQGTGRPPAQAGTRTAATTTATTVTASDNEEPPGLAKPAAPSR